MTNTSESHHGVFTDEGIAVDGGVGASVRG